MNWIIAAQLGLALLGTIRGHGFAPWATLGVLMVGAYLIGLMFSGLWTLHGFLVVTRFIDSFIIFVLACFVFVSPEEEP